MTKPTQHPHPETVTPSTGDQSPLISVVPSKNRARYSRTSGWPRTARGRVLRRGWLPRSAAAEDADLLPIARAAAALDEESGMAPVKVRRPLWASLAYSFPMP